MSENTIYAAPEAELTVEDDEKLTEFYVVSIRKFNILFISTMGIYSIYWFYKNWKIIKQKEGSNIWPVPRGIFNIFFTHSLFVDIEMGLKGKTDKTWSSSTQATIFVLSSFTSSICDQLSSKSIGSPITDILTLVLLLPMWSSLLSAQKHANIASGDKAGETNSQLTGVNILFVVLGLLFWGLIIVGYAMIFAGFI